MNDKKTASKVLETIYLVFMFTGMIVICWGVYSTALGTYAKTCEIVQKKLLMR